MRPNPFPAAGQTEWRALAERALAGAPIETLTARSRDGLAIGPLYPVSADPSVRPWRGTPGPCRILTRVDDPDEDRSFAQAAADLAGGAEGLSLVFADAPCAFGLGLPDLSAPAARRFFARVEGAPDAELHLDILPRGPDACVRFANDWLEASEPSVWRRLRLCFDPALAAPAALAALAAVAVAAGDRLTSCVCADGRRAHGAGGSEAQELAFVLAGGVAALRALDGGGLSLEKGRRLLSFCMAADGDLFLTLAKFRALRLLWSRIEEVSGLLPEPIHLRAETAWRTMTRRDPWSNALRATAASGAAVLGGADGVTVLPFTRALGVPDPSARRFARNLGLVLRHEAHLAAVADPAGGSGAFEAMTEGLCLAAWDLFQQVEALGGLGATAARELLRRKISEVAAERARAVARREDAIVGVSDFPSLAERSVAVLAPLGGEPAPCMGLPATRLAEPFEVLRDRSDAMLAAGAGRPGILLVGLEAPAACAPSVAFATNLFEAGGFETVVHHGPAQAPDAAAALSAGGLRLACLCLGPRTAPEPAAALAQALSRAGARRLYVAGPPPERCGVSLISSLGELLVPGCDALAILRQAWAALG